MPTTFATLESFLCPFDDQMAIQLNVSFSNKRNMSHIEHTSQVRDTTCEQRHENAAAKTK